MGAIISGGGGASKTQAVFQSGWLGVDLSTLASTPGQLSTDTGASPAAVTASDQGNQIISGDAAGEHATLYAFRDTNVSEFEKVLLGVLGFHRQTLGTASTDFPLIGFINHSDPVDSNDMAAFRPSAGDDTSGNVRVDNNGTDTDGSLSYPTFTEPHYYEIVVDITNTQTEFYVDSSVASDDPADVTLSAVPRRGQGRSLGIGIDGSNNSVFHVLSLRAAMKVF